MIDEKLQTLGTNTRAQKILTEKITAYTQAFAEEMGPVTAQTVIDKYYDCGFYFLYMDDDASDRRFKNQVDAVLRKFPLLQKQIEAFRKFLTDDEAKFTEEYGGKDVKSTEKNPEVVNRTFTDNLTRKSTVEYAGVGVTGSQSLADDTTEGPVDGKNTQNEEIKTTWDGADTETTVYGRTRTYPTGKTLLERYKETSEIPGPVNAFVCAFAAIFRCRCDYEEGM